MKIVFWGNGNRGVSCLEALHRRGYGIEAVVAHPETSGQWYGSVAALAEQLGIPCIDPKDPNTEEVATTLEKIGADLFILAGYGKILTQKIIDIANLMSINLHAGKLPNYRGSSPMNWALINGDDSFTLSIIKIDAGVDSGDIVMERTFDVSVDYTIRDLHAVANEQFPLMLLEVVSQLEGGGYVLAPQNTAQASYYPLRFPDDGLVLWDVHTALQVHNRIRALTEPYPCAFTLFNGKRVKLLSSELNESDFFGEPGRVYRKSSRGLLVCALDKALWIKEAVFAETQEPLASQIERYESLATLRQTMLLNVNSTS